MWSEEKSKIAHRCGEKRVLKSKCKKKIEGLRALFQVPMSKNCKSASRCGEKRIFK